MLSNKDAARILTMLLDAYPSKELRDPAGYVKTMIAVTRDYDAGHVETAALDCIAELKFFPSMAELRERAERVKLSGHGKTAEIKAPQGKLYWLSFGRFMEKLEHLRPEQWTEDTRAEFRAFMGRDVDFERDDPGSPWMAWTLEAVTA